MIGLAIFLLETAYVVEEFVVHPGSLSCIGRRSEPTMGNAILGWIVIGLPALVYVLTTQGSLLGVIERSGDPAANTDRPDGGRAWEE